jgi:hypothetical protein
VKQIFPDANAMASTKFLVAQASAPAGSGGVPPPGRPRYEELQRANFPFVSSQIRVQFVAVLNQRFCARRRLIVNHQLQINHQS